MPTAKQIENNRNTSNFNPVQGGLYSNGILSNKSDFGTWWGSETYKSATRYRLRYDGGNLYTGNSNRDIGFYIRCVSEEKTVTDLTYLQDMTGEIANNTLDGTTANSSPTIWSPTALAGKNAMEHITLLAKLAMVLGMEIIVSIVAR